MSPPLRYTLLLAAIVSLAACGQTQPITHASAPGYKVITVKGPQQGNGPPGVYFGDIPADSGTWAGYVDRPSTASLGQDFTYVQSYFVVPTLDPTQCATTPSAATAFWVGLGGVPNVRFSSDAGVAQTGIEALCSQLVTSATDSYIPQSSPTNRPEYVAWWESFPAPPVFYFTVSPNDVIFASVAYSKSSGTYTGYLVDVTQRVELAAQSQRCMDTATQPATNPNTSCNRTADVVAEDPVNTTTSTYSQPAPFNSVPFSGAGVQDNADESGSLTANTWDPHRFFIGSQGAEILTPSSIGQGEGCQAHPGYPAVCFGMGPSASVFDVVNPRYTPVSSPTPSTVPELQMFAAGTETPLLYEPQKVEFTGDSSGYLDGLAWSRWNAAGAEGMGTLHINNCQPGCATGTFIAYPATVTLSGAAQTPKGYLYTSMAITVPTSPSLSQRFAIPRCIGGSC